MGNLLTIKNGSTVKRFIKPYARSQEAVCSFTTLLTLLRLPPLLYRTLHKKEGLWLDHGMFLPRQSSKEEGVLQID